MTETEAAKTKAKNRTEAVTAVIAVVVFYMVLEGFGITCPIKYVTGISCAGCGMSRAWIALLHLHVREAFAYHPLFFLPPIAVMVMLFKKKINPNICKICIFTIVAVFVIIYLYRMIFGNDNIVVFEPQNGLVFRLIQKITEILK